MNVPVKTNQKKPIYEVYEATEALWMVKVGYDDGEKYIIVNEQPKYIKIMDTLSSKLQAKDEYFVSKEFALSENVHEIMRGIYTNGVMYYFNNYE